MSVFIDTSAFFALLSISDSHHGEAGRIWARLLEAQTEMHTHNYIVVETVSLIQRRFGFKAAEAFLVSLPGVVRVHWIDEDLHRRAEGAFRTAGRKTLSLVDCASFEVMRSRSIETAFAFDEHFMEHGFAVLKA
ncbi:MAG: PIN domain-containing protein [Candidatus Aminicenantes bacterium]|nr:PIN domain-containing protein [Candidatus Aminicenantes bacterium]